MNDTAEKTLTRKVGQRVLITGGRFHGAARITKINPKNILITMENGKRVNSHPSFLSDLAEGAEVPGRYESTVADLALTPHLTAGSLARLKGQAGLFVVLADKFDKINVARLGGDNDRYFRASRAQVTALSAEETATVLGSLA